MSISSGPGGYRMGNEPDAFGSPRNGSRRNGKPSTALRVVWIKAYQPSHRYENRLSRYVISQYVQDQCGYVNMCWSWKRSLGFPISRLWERCGINGPPGMRIGGSEVRSKSRGSCSSRPGRISFQGIPFGSAARFCNWCWGRGLSIRRCEDDLASMRFETAESIWSGRLRTGSHHV